MSASEKVVPLGTLQELMGIAQAGLFYAKDPFDLQRYARLQEIVADMVAHSAQMDGGEARAILRAERGYLTPKTVVRAVVMRGGQVLLTREREDGRWSLPGGWADPGEGPGQMAVRETLEETGWPVTARRVLGVLDQGQHGHPPELFACWLVFVACELSGERVGGERTGGENIETLESDFFDPAELPPLSLNRNTPDEVRRMCALWGDKGAGADLD